MRLDMLRSAYKTVENISVDYSDMTPAEVKEIDSALDIILKLAKETITKAEAEAEDQRYSLNVRLKSGKEFNFTCSDYTINYNELLGCVTRFKFENGKGDCPVYLNTTDIESISINSKVDLV